MTSPLTVLLLWISAPWQAFGLIGMQMVAGTLVGALVPAVLQEIAPPGLRARIFAIYAIVTPLGGLSVIAVGAISEFIFSGPRGLLGAVVAMAAPAWVAAGALIYLAERRLGLSA